MYYYRVSKYDPDYRIDGTYQRDEWTSVSDIGRVYNGERFTAEEYEIVERAYIDFALAVCALQNVVSLTVINLENQNRLPWSNRKQLSLQQSAEFMKANLREECWGRLVTDGFLFETGYDYYVHIGCDLPLDLVVPLACRYHLFVEEWSKVAVTLATERLILRPWDESDAEALYQYAGDPEVGPPAGWQPHTSVENSREIIRDVLSAHETYAVCLAEDEDTPIGSIGLHRNDLACHKDEYELGYWLAKPFWGQGLIPEAAQEILRHAFEDLSMSRVWCGYYDGNVKSRRVQEKLGFTYHHTTEGIELPHLNETRIGHASLLTKEAWENLHE